MFIQPFQGKCWLFVCKNFSQWSAQRVRPVCLLRGIQHVTRGHFQYCTLSSSNRSSSNKILAPFQHRKSVKPFDRLFISTSSNQQYLDVDTRPLEERVKIVQYELHLLREEGVAEVPTEVSEEDLQKLANISSARRREKFLRYLFVTEFKKATQSENREIRRNHAIDHYNKVSEELNAGDETMISYGLWRNSIVLKIGDTKMNNFYNSRLITARLFGQPIVFDNDYDGHMTPRAKVDLANQICFCLATNKTYLDPFYIHMCNYDRQHESAQYIEHRIPTLYSNVFPVDTHQENYLDLFPRDKLIYLTPDAEEILSSYDHDAIYVIGNFVDKGSTPPLSLMKARKEGIRMQKLPMDIYLDWCRGSKCLPLNQVLGILLEMKHSGSWVKAFDKYIPRRKLIKYQQNQMKAHQGPMKLLVHEK